MSEQGPIVVVSSREDDALTSAVAGIEMFPLVEVGWSEAIDAAARLRPAAVIATAGGDVPFRDLARVLAAAAPYVPLIALDPEPPLPPNALPFTAATASPARLIGRLNAALRVRSLHATALRRLAEGAFGTRMPQTDPIHDATVLLMGRGASYPALSVALGETMGVVGALSIEAAAKHLNAREMDGIVIGEGFTPRVVDAFLTVLSEDSRFRNLPVALAGGPGLMMDHDLPNLEICAGDPRTVAASALPLIRQHAFAARLGRVLRAIDAGGLLDPRTGLLTRDAFRRDFEAAVADAQARGAGLSVARIGLSDRAVSERMRLDAARIVGRLLRQVDFATLDGDGAIVVAFPDTSVRNTQAIARRLVGVLRHTALGTRRDRRLDPHVTVTTLQPSDSATALLARLRDDPHRAAS
jgi:GGDEF domain-containing protein